jgi:hypothetical protein
MANDEDRMTNQTAMTNDNNGGAGVRRGVPFVIVVSSFLRHSFVIPISSFVIISPPSSQCAINRSRRKRRL